MIMRAIEDLEGIKIGGTNITNIRYADDTALIADSESKLQALVDCLVRESIMKGLSVNITKTQVMVISKSDTQETASITIDGKILEQVSRFSYLGSIITQNGRCDEDIKTRIIIAKEAFNKVKNLVTNTSISVGLRKRFIRAYAWSTFLYGSEAWNISNPSIYW